MAKDMYSALQTITNLFNKLLERDETITISLDEFDALEYIQEWLDDRPIE